MIIEIDLDEVRGGWKYCPNCGTEILQVYPGDYYVFIECEDGCAVDFKIQEVIEWEREVPYLQ